MVPVSVTHILLSLHAGLVLFCLSQRSFTYVAENMSLNFYIL